MLSISDYANKREKSKRMRISSLLNIFRTLSDKPEMTLEEAEIYAADFLTQPAEEIYQAVLSYIRKAENTLSPGSINNYVSLFFDYLRKNRIYFNKDELDDINRSLPPNYIITEDEALTVEKIRDIIAHSDTLLSAFILAACSSGARIGELLSLMPDDLEYLEDYDVYSFRLTHRKTKSGKPHRYFISHEAKQAIDDYLKVRYRYIDSKRIKAHCLKKKPDESEESLFVLSSNSFRLKLDNAVKRAGLYSVDPETKRSRIHPHSFRKFADTTFKEVVGINMGNALIGHDEGLSKSYRRYDLRQLADAYRKIEPYVTIKAPADYIEVKTHIGGEVDKIRAALAAQSLEMAEMKQRLEYTEIKLAFAKRYMKE